jgi:hypothetical protein
MATQKDIDIARDYFIQLSEKAFESYSTLEFESLEWQTERDKYVSLSNTAAQLMGEKSASPFIL